MKIPSNITKEHVIKAMKKIDSEGIINKRRSARDYLVEYNGKTYPPKLVISFANIFASGKELSWSDFKGGDETNEPLRNLGFKVIKK